MKWLHKTEKFINKLYYYLCEVFEMKKKYGYGKVKFVSATGGIKFENEEQWYNPANKEIKDLR